jgi:hypothetical protein
MSEDDGILEPWDQRADESTVAYADFCVYRDLGPQRSQQKAAKALGKTRQHLSIVSSRHDWVDRAGAWDLEQDRQRRLAMQAENVAAARRHAQQMQGALQALSLPNLEVLRRVAQDQDLLHKMPFEQLLDLAVKASRVLPRLVVADRLSRGMSTENVEHGGSVEVHHERADRMSDAELDEFLARTLGQAQLPAPEDVDAPG